MSFFGARERVVWNAPLVGIDIVSSLLFGEAMDDWKAEESACLICTRAFRFWIARIRLSSSDDDDDDDAFTRTASFTVFVSILFIPFSAAAVDVVDACNYFASRSCWSNSLAWCCINLKILMIASRACWWLLGIIGSVIGVVKQWSLGRMTIGWWCKKNFLVGISCGMIW